MGSLTPLPFGTIRISVQIAAKRSGPARTEANGSGPVDHCRLGAATQRRHRDEISSGVTFRQRPGVDSLMEVAPMTDSDERQPGSTTLLGAGADSLKA
jgi:hypothetical protein